MPYHPLWSCESIDGLVCCCDGVRVATQADLPSTACIPVLGVRTRMHGDRAVLSPHGEIDYVSAHALDQALAGLPDGVAGVVLDMAEVTFMDSAGVHFLYSLRAYGRRRGIPVEAIHFGRQPRQVLEVDGSYPLADGLELAEPVTGPVTALVHRPVSSPALYLVPSPSAAGNAPPSSDEEVRRMREEIAQLRQARDIRPAIDQARGMIMALGPCASWSAWDFLVDVSQHCKIEIHDVAAALVATTAGQPLSEELRHEVEQAFCRLRSSGTPPAAGLESINAGRVAAPD